MSDVDDLIEQIQLLLLYEYQCLTPASLNKIIRDRMPSITPARIREAVHSLVDQGTLHYTNHLCTSHLEVNFARAVAVSQHIVLAPEQMDQQDRPDVIVVKLAAGDAFGSGEHPTTRLALQAVDWVISELKHQGSLLEKKALDIGTGSGVLAIAAVKLGLASALGIDIDPVACFEAKTNLKLNAMTHRIDISATPLENITGVKFDLIMANLRVPTLKKFIPMMLALTHPGGYWVLSGFRPDELAGLLKTLPCGMIQERWQQSELNWAAVVLKYFPPPIAPS